MKRRLAHETAASKIVCPFWIVLYENNSTASTMTRFGLY
jgi:hypothetical protein